MTGEYSESVDEAPRFMLGEIEENRINVLLDPEQEVNRNGETGYDPDRQLYDRSVLEKVSETAREWDHAWHQHAELLFRYASYDGDAPDIGRKAREQLSEIIDEDLLTGKSFDYLDEKSSGKTSGKR